MPEDPIQIDSDELPRRFIAKARRRLEKTKPNYTYDELIGEAERIKEEEQASGKR